MLGRDKHLTREIPAQVLIAGVWLIIWHSAFEGSRYIHGPGVFLFNIFFFFHVVGFLAELEPDRPYLLQFSKIILHFSPAARQDWLATWTQTTEERVGTDCEHMIALSSGVALEGNFSLHYSSFLAYDISSPLCLSLMPLLLLFFWIGDLVL